MGRIAKVLDFIRRAGGKSDTKCDPGGGAIRQAPHAQPAGDDGHPLPGDYAVLVEVPQAGGYSAVGYVDPRNAQTAGPGERRIYARSADGAQVVELWLKSDGSAKLSNADGYGELKASGEVDINGCIIGTDGSVTSPSKLAAPSILGDDSELVGHRHPGVVVGDGVSGPNQPGDGGGGGGFGPAADNTWSGANVFEQPVTVAEPTAPEHAASMGYVDALVTGVAGGFGGQYRDLSVVVTGTGYQGDIAAGVLILESAGGAVVRLRDVSVAFNAAVSGAGGLDTGTVAAGSWYHVYVIYNPDTSAVAALVSLSGSAPALPSGYTHFALIGEARAGAGAFLPHVQRGDRVRFGSATVPAPRWLVSPGGALGALNLAGLLPPSVVSADFAITSDSTSWAGIHTTNSAALTSRVLFALGGYAAASVSNVQISQQTTLYYFSSAGAAPAYFGAYGYERAR